MGIFGFLGKAITGPFRGIGKLLQGDVKGMLGAFGDTLKVGAPFIPGMGVPAAIGLSALGGAAQTLDDPNQGVGNFLKNALAGGAWGGGASLGLKGINQLLSGATQAAQPAALIGPGNIPTGGGPPAWMGSVARGMGDVGNWLKGAGGDKARDSVSKANRDVAQGKLASVDAGKARDTAKNVDRDKATSTLQGKDAGKARDAAKNVDRDKAQSTLQSRDAGKSRDVAKSRDLASKPARSRDSALTGAGNAQGTRQSINRGQSSNRSMSSRGGGGGRAGGGGGFRR